ncbi:MAG: hypothetical protein LBH44_01350 [Treponema sp.]|nr:hypothetical protein [Treponema sp.]
MRKKILFLLFTVLIFMSGCNGMPAVKAGAEDRWNVYGLYDPEQNVRLSDFYDGYESETMNYRTEDLFWYRKADRGSVSIDEYLESEAVYLGHTQGGIEFCGISDMEGLKEGVFTSDRPSRIVFMKVQDVQKFSHNLDKYTVLKIRYRYLYRPAYVPKGQDISSVSNRRVSQAKTSGLVSVSEFFLDEYEITGKTEIQQSLLSKGLNRAGDIFSALVRGTDRAIGKLLGIDDVVPEGEIKLENGLTYQKVGLGEIVKKSKTYEGPDLLLTSRVKLHGDRGDDVWAFREAEGDLIHTMKYTGHIPSSMKTIRIYYRLRDGGIFEVDEVKQASIFNDQW